MPSHGSFFALAPPLNMFRLPPKNPFFWPLNFSASARRSSLRPSRNSGALLDHRKDETDGVVKILELVGAHPFEPEIFLLRRQVVFSHVLDVDAWFKYFFRSAPAFPSSGLRRGPAHQKAPDVPPFGAESLGKSLPAEPVLKRHHPAIGRQRERGDPKQTGDKAFHGKISLSAKPCVRPA